LKSVDDAMRNPSLAARAVKDVKLHPKADLHGDSASTHGGKHKTDMQPTFDQSQVLAGIPYDKSSAKDIASSGRMVTPVDVKAPTASLSYVPPMQDNEV
jgi:hypothetical protein